jgi:hypothetical protein
VTMMIKIVCPSCGTEGSLSLADPAYEGPYKCWKCRSLFTVTIANGKLGSCEPLSQEEFDRQQDARNLRDRFKR